MIVNSFMKNRQIWGNKIVLVPYKHIHVERYNCWMQDPDIQYLTASEPLTLEQEYEMLKIWNNDSYKCTFIVLDKSLYSLTDYDETKSMIGDVNLFIDHDDTTKAEIEVMIAELSHQNCGKGKEAVLLMLRFAIELIEIKTFVAKIKFNNLKSQQMFKNLGFNEISKSEIFQEIEYNLSVDEQFLDTIIEKTPVFSYHLL